MLTPTDGWIVIVLAENERRLLYVSAIFCNSDLPFIRNTNEGIPVAIALTKHIPADMPLNSQSMDTISARGSPGGYVFLLLLFPRMDTRQILPTAAETIAISPRISDFIFFF